MQTFMAFSSYSKTATALDDARLGKQRLEAYQVLEHLLEIPGRENFYPNHPIMAMWRGYEYALCVYGMETCRVWHTRGKDDMFHRFARYGTMFNNQGFDFEHPPWYRDEDFMRSHRSNLYRKDPRYYRAFSPARGTPLNLPYLWPSVSEDGSYRLLVSAADRKRIAMAERALPDDLAARLGLA